MKQNRLLISLLVGFATWTRVLLSLRYRVTVKGMDVVKNAKRLLILPNHQALVDPMIILSQLYRDTKAIPLVSSSFYDLPVLKNGFKTIGAIRVSNLEAGSRNVNVLNQITGAVLEGFEKGTNVMLYPGGQLASKGIERIVNKKSAHRIVSEMPEEVTVVGLRITGLWGSMWSKAHSGKTPNFFLLVLKSLFFFLANLIFFLPRRLVTIEMEDLTQDAKTNSEKGVKAFNTFLEDYYNKHGEEKPNYLKHFFFLPGK